MPALQGHASVAYGFRKAAKYPGATLSFELSVAGVQPARGCFLQIPLQAEIHGA